MSTLPSYMIALLNPFLKLFCATKTRSNALVLLIGTILCRGGRTVCSALKTMGLSGEQTFDKYHKLLNRSKWSAHKGAKTLLQELIGSETETVVIAIDEHIERRSGKKIKAKGCYRDGVRSTKKHTVKCFGLKWITVMLLKVFSWNSRSFALPFLTILAPSEKANEKAGKRHKTTIDWTIQTIKQIRKWLPDRRIIITGDGGFANANLGWVCLQKHVHLVTRLRLDARLFDFPSEQSSGPGRRPKKGQQLLKPKEMLIRTGLDWTKAEVQWYGGNKRKVEYVTFTCLWHVVGNDPLPVRIVLLRDPTNEYQPIALMGITHDFSLSAIEIIENFVSRWNQEVTHKEVREHLGVETQRQWSDKAIARTTPILFALYSLILLMADRINSVSPLKPQSTAWYHKKHATFSDALREVRKELWKNELNLKGFDSENEPDKILSPDEVLRMMDLLSNTG